MQWYNFCLYVCRIFCTVAWGSAHPAGSGQKAAVPCLCHSRLQYTEPGPWLVRQGQLSHPGPTLWSHISADCSPPLELWLVTCLMSLSTLSCFMGVSIKLCVFMLTCNILFLFVNLRCPSGTWGFRPGVCISTGGWALCGQDGSERSGTNWQPHPGSTQQLIHPLHPGPWPCTLGHQQVCERKTIINK